MSSKTKPLFYYGHVISDTNYAVDIKEGITTYEIDLSIGDYSLSEFVTELEDQLNNNAGQVYTVSIDRSTRLVTISASTAFDLLVTSGRGTSLYPLIGFVGADKTGTNSYTGSLGSGSEWRPQNIPTEYIGKKFNKEKISPSINESANGDIESLTFGDRRFITLNQTLITDEPQQASYFLDNDASGVDNAIAFLDAVIEKSKFEFMEDRDTPNTFDIVLMESMAGSSTGTGMTLERMFNEGTAPYYETGEMKMRVIE